jgi:transposase
MGIRRRRSIRSGRALLPSLGRPPVAGRDEQTRFWRAIAKGLSSEDAALQAGVSQPVGTRWFRKAGGMPPTMFSSSAKPLSGRYLSLAEREEIALLKVQGYSIREIARRLSRSASTISRELRRNAATRSGGLEYRATTAQWHAERSARRPKATKLALNPALRTYVEQRLAGVVTGPWLSWRCLRAFLGTYAPNLRLVCRGPSRLSHLRSFRATMISKECSVPDSPQGVSRMLRGTSLNHLFAFW